MPPQIWGKVQGEDACCMACRDFDYEWHRIGIYSQVHDHLGRRELPGLLLLTVSLTRGWFAACEGKLSGLPDRLMLLAIGGSVLTRNLVDLR